MGATTDAGLGALSAPLATSPRGGEELGDTQANHAPNGNISSQSL